LARGTATPARRCIVTGEVRDPATLIRFVIGPDGAVVPDIAGKLPGRGIWVTAAAAPLHRAVEKRLFARAAKRQVTIDPGLPATVERLLVGHCLGLLGLARRAGQLVTGFEQVRAFVAAGKAAVLLTARDGAPGGRAKLRGLAGALPTVGLFDVSELSLALGRQNVVNAALGPGGLTSRFCSETVRLAGFRDDSGVADASKAVGDVVT